MIITLASSKGGVGKSTITGCLAGVWAADGNTVHIVDLDNNRTVSRWFADAARRPDGITVSTPEPTGLTEHLAELAASTAPDLVLIDVAGTYERGPDRRRRPRTFDADPGSADRGRHIRGGACRTPHHVGVPGLSAANRCTACCSIAFNRWRPALSSMPPWKSCASNCRGLKTRILQRAAYEELGLSGLPPHFADLKRPTVSKAVRGTRCRAGRYRGIAEVPIKVKLLKGAA